jgi:WD40 repeat protein
VSGSGDKSVRVWDVSTGKVQSVLEGHTDWVQSVAFSSDGTRIASGSRDKSVWVWDVSTGTVQSVLEGHTSGVSSVAFSSDGTRIASGSDDQSVRVWDVSTGKVQSSEDSILGYLYGAGPWRQEFMYQRPSDFHVTAPSLPRLATAHTSVMDSNMDQDTSVVSSSNNTRMAAQQDSDSDSDSNQTRTGWLLSLDGNNNVMFVPPSANLPDPPTILELTNRPSSSVSFASAALGGQWHKCYSESPVSACVERH